jgi:hypothetical protein
MGRTPQDLAHSCEGCQGAPYASRGLPLAREVTKTSCGLTSGVHDERAWVTQATVGGEAEVSIHVEAR